MPPTSVFIGGLGYDVEKEDLEKEFSKFGALNKVWVARNPPGFAFIEFEYDQDADTAIKEMNGAFIKGCHIRVDLSRGGGKARGHDGRVIGHGEFHSGFRGRENGSYFRGGHERTYNDRSYNYKNSGFRSRSPMGESKVMAQLKPVYELNNALSLDEPLKQGPIPRWQRKQKDNSPELNSTNTSLNVSTPFLNASANKSTSKLNVSPFKGPGFPQPQGWNAPGNYAGGYGGQSYGYGGQGGYGNYDYGYGGGYGSDNGGGYGSGYGSGYDCSGWNYGQGGTGGYDGTGGYGGTGDYEQELNFTDLPHNDAKGGITNKNALCPDYIDFEDLDYTELFNRYWYDSSLVDAKKDEEQFSKGTVSEGKSFSNAWSQTEINLSTFQNFDIESIKNSIEKIKIEFGNICEIFDKNINDNKLKNVQKTPCVETQIVKKYKSHPNNENLISIL